MGIGCNGCHGGTGGGGMCPPISNDAWNYDPNDDTLFRLITLGSNCKDYPDCMEKEGFPRTARETVSFPMPSQGQRSISQPNNPAPITKADDVWKIISWIRVINPNSLKPKAAPPPPIAFGGDWRLRYRFSRQAACQLGGFRVYQCPFRDGR